MRMLASLFVSSLVVILTLLFAVGCESSKDSTQQFTPEIIGKRDATPWIKEFLENRQKELAKAVDPQKLQAWAANACQELQTTEPHRRIKVEDVPETALGDKLRRPALAITAINNVTNQQRYVILLEGGGSQMGWYGLEVGDKEYRPRSESSYYLRWIPGCYLFFTPPL